MEFLSYWLKNCLQFCIWLNVALIEPDHMSPKSLVDYKHPNSREQVRFFAGTAVIGTGMVAAYFAG